MLKAHSHAFWVYGVIVGLAIREALVKVLAAPLSSSATPHDMLLNAFRLLIFLGMIIRFYLGSAIYFEEVYCGPNALVAYPTKNYGIDFLLGLIHFILFFGWSETITSPDRFAHGLSSYLFTLGVILLYDFVWWAICFKYSTCRTIRVWAVLNGATVLVSYLVLLFLNTFAWFGNVGNEMITLIPIGFMIIVDFGEMISGRNLITDYIVGILGKAGMNTT
jgi:hypothetical protein